MKKMIFLGIISMVVTTASALSPIEKGDKISDFTAIDENDNSWQLSAQRADYLVFYFYPAAFTGGCTAQACSYRDHGEEFSKLKAQVIGISGDEHGNLLKFKEHHNLNFKLLSDPEGRIAEIFGVPTGDGKTIEKEIDGQTLQLTRGITTSRWTFIMDGNGKLIYKDDDVSAATDPESVLKFMITHNNRKTCVIK